MPRGRETDDARSGEGLSAVSVRFALKKASAALFLCLEPEGRSHNPGFKG
jgi:hypothetical protein